MLAETQGQVRAPSTAIEAESNAYQSPPLESTGQTRAESDDDMDVRVSYSRFFKESREDSYSLQSRASSGSGKASTPSSESDVGKKQLGVTKHVPHQLASARKSQGLSKSRHLGSVFGDSTEKDTPIKKGIHARQQVARPSVSKGLTPSSAGKHHSKTESVSPKSARQLKPSSLEKTGAMKRKLPPILPPNGKLSSKKKHESAQEARSPMRAALGKDQRTEDILCLLDSIPEMPVSESSELLQLIAADSGPMWSIFGRYLGVSDEDIEDIKDGCHFDNERCARVIKKWLRSTESKATYAQLACALVNARQYGKVRGLKPLVPQRSYDDRSHRSVHIVNLPLTEESLSSLMVESEKERESGQGGAEVTVQSVSSSDHEAQDLTFGLPRSKGGSGLKVLEYVLKGIALDGVEEVVVSLHYHDN
jgi:hypothetical protein